MVKFMINTNQRNKYIAKLLKVKDNEITRLLMLVCSLRPNEIDVKVIEVISSTVLQSNNSLKPRVIYSYTFKEKKPVSDSQFTIERKTFQEAISEVCTCGITGTTSGGTVDRASKLFDTLMNRTKLSEAE